MELHGQLKQVKLFSVVYVVSGEQYSISRSKNRIGKIGSPYVVTVTVATNGSGVATSTALQVKTAADLLSNVNRYFNSDFS